MTPKNKNARNARRPCGMLQTKSHSNNCTPPAACAGAAETFASSSLSLSASYFCSAFSTFAWAFATFASASSSSALHCFICSVLLASTAFFHCACTSSCASMDKSRSRLAAPNSCQAQGCFAVQECSLPTTAQAPSNAFSARGPTSKASKQNTLATTLSEARPAWHIRPGQRSAQRQPG